MVIGQGEYPLRNVSGLLHGVLAVPAYLFISSITNAFEHHETISDIRSWVLIAIYGACWVSVMLSTHVERTPVATLIFIGLVAVVATVGVLSACIRIAQGSSF
jgi:hypothetical protein